MYRGNRESYLSLNLSMIGEDVKPFLVRDEESGKLYDTRNEYHIERLTDKGTNWMFMSHDIIESDSVHQTIKKRGQPKQKPWTEWQKEKNRSNYEVIRAAETNNLSSLRKYLDDKVMFELVAEVNCQGLYDWTPLHISASKGFLPLVLELLQHPEIEVEALTSMKRTPLHLASSGSLDIVKALIKEGANPNCLDSEGFTPLHYAAE